MSTRKRIRNDDTARFWSKVSKGNGCWEWVGTVSNRHGYGYFHVQVAGKSVKVQAHRRSYELTVGPIPDGLVLDHLCRNRSCVNPAHLRPISNRENVLCGVGLTAVHAQKVKCVNGHAFTQENTYIRPGTTHRVCRACRRAPDSRRRSYERIPCPTCGEMVGRKNMPRHRRRLHPDEVARQSLLTKESK